VIKNNFVALFGHIVISIIFFLILFPIGLKIDPNGDSFRMAPLFSIVSAFCWFLYIFWGYQVMEPQISKLKNLFSVSLLGILGLVLTIIDFSKLLSQNISGMSFTYSIATFSIFFIGLKDSFKGPVSALFVIVSIFSFIPSLLLWVGIEYHKKKITKLN
jgi:hypothetical protein